VAVVVDAWRRARLCEPSDPPHVAGGRTALVLWAGLVLETVAWGALLVDGRRLGLGAAPFAGRWEWHAGLGLVPAMLVGVATVAGGGTTASRLAWPRVPLVAGATAAIWAATLAVGDGWSRLSGPLTTRHEYEPLAGRIDGLGAFLDGYVDRLGGYPIHVQGHPPGPVVVAWGLDRVGLGGAGWLAALALAGWGAAVAAALVAARAVAGEVVARRAAPALVLLPAAVWAGTSLDALFAGVIAVGIALAAVGAVRGSAAYVVGSGVVLGVALLMTYGAVPLLLVPVVLMGVFGDRPARMVSLLVAGVLVPLGWAALAGFWWLEGLASTRDAYWSGIAGHRPGLYLTLLGNPGALAVAVGPAAVAGIAATIAAVSGGGTAVRRIGPGALPLAAVLAVAAADVSQHARGEVERIWLPFVPWLALAVPGGRRSWLAVQAGLALLMQSVLVSPW
jgi:methylthioxylose transferase